jgi:hypothetical protein
MAETVSQKFKLIERCAKRVEAYAFSLELQRHIGLPDPVEALLIAAQKVRDLSVEGDHGHGRS